MSMTISSTTGDDPEMVELFRSVRHLSRYSPDLVARLTAMVSVVRSTLPTATLSAERTEIAKQFGRDLGEVALLAAASTADEAADKRLIARMPAERVTMLKTFAGASVATMAARARTLGWDRDRPNYPAPQR